MNKDVTTHFSISWRQLWSHHQQTFFRRSVYAEPFAKALGIKRGQPRPWVMDATCGLGKDSLLMSFWGCTVWAFERHPLLYQKLQAQDHSLISDFKLFDQDAKTFLQAERATWPEVIYLDPMYSDVNQKSLPQKEILCLRKIVGQDNDAEELFDLSLSRAAKRVVVKRPLKAPPLKTKADVVYKGKSTRYDMYLAKRI